MNLLNRDFRQMKIAGQHTPFWGGQHGRFLHIMTDLSGKKVFENHYMNNKVEFDINNFSPGTYLINYQSNTSNFDKIIIKL